MFDVGDKILYPMLGVGIIEEIDEKDVLGKKRLYYTLNIPQNKLQVMIPSEEAEALGIRQIVELDTLENILSEFHLGITDPHVFEDQRYCRDLNKKKIRTGDIYKGTEIIRDLIRKSLRNKLGAEDINMLNSARRMFISEVMEVKGIAQEQADQLLDQVLLASK